MGWPVVTTSTTVPLVQQQHQTQSFLSELNGSLQRSSADISGLEGGRDASVSGLQDVDILLSAELDNMFELPIDINPTPLPHNFLEIFLDPEDPVLQGTASTANPWGAHISEEYQQQEADKLESLQCLLQQLRQLVDPRNSEGPPSAEQQTVTQLQIMVHQLQQQIQAMNSVYQRSSHLAGSSSEEFESTAVTQERSTSFKKGSGLPCRRTIERKKKLGRLESLIEKKKAQAAELERQNDHLRRRQGLLATFIKVREEQIQAWSAVQGTGKQGAIHFNNSPLVGSMTVAEICGLDFQSAGAGYQKLISGIYRLLQLAGWPSTELLSFPALFDPTYNLAPTLPHPVHTSLPSDHIFNGLRLNSVNVSCTGDALNGVHVQIEPSSPSETDCKSEQKQASLSGSNKESAQGSMSNDNDLELSPEEAYQQLEKLVNGMNDLGKYIEFFNPEFNTALLSRIETSDVPAHHWRKVIASSCLSEDQVEDIIVLDALISQLISKVRQERSVLFSALHESVLSYQLSTRLVSNVQLNADNVQCMDQLLKNVKKERFIIFLSSEVFFSHVLSIKQRAAMLVTSYPVMVTHLPVIQQVIDMYSHKRLASS
ncbi:hypothetical protein CEUSTIGMA_g11815.t1 [Chlamydomonas eustigma]|uniref:Uncharacterized protein n=1 Tax=Chlamydomonas eustigma TaxID=1157962 RepID=A0A250XN14_9CHLO|nr:hypothetical protein CEUSTIGMA_g11815.t1 [Chlamydomonas eustigma]|eukprot:GAX84393.1 hypothetical protein CEUSTIGMA_g11815.t1 [Chlamydomonas eustigma]